MAKPIGNLKMNLATNDKVSQRLMTKFAPKSAQDPLTAEAPTPPPPPHVRKRAKFKTRKK